MLIAQAMGEYGGLSAIASALSSRMASLESTVRSFDMSTWALIIAAGLLVWFVVGRTR